jgi:hypothetical protein
MKSMEEKVDERLYWGEDHRDTSVQKPYNLNYSFFGQ